MTKTREKYCENEKRINKGCERGRQMVKIKGDNRGKWSYVLAIGSRQEAGVIIKLMAQCQNSIKKKKVKLNDNVKH